MASRRNNDRSDAHDGGDGNGGFSLNPPSPSLGPTALAQRLYISQSQAPKRIKLDSGRRERKLESEKLVSFSPSGGSHEETGVAVPGLLPRPSQSSLKCRMSSHGLTPELLNLIQPVALEFEQETTEVEEAVSMEWQILPCLKASIPGHVRESLLQTNPGSLHSKASLQVGPFPKVSGVITPHPGPIAIATTASHTSQPLKPPGIPAVSGWKHKTKIEKPHSFEKHDIMSWKSKRGSFAKTTSEADSCDYQWMAFLKLLREQPDYPEFIYLQPSAVRFSAFDPYDLEIVQRCEISSLYYYTMSSKGVTLFKGLDAEFTPLDEWEADFKFYKCVMKLNVFSKYKLWKALAIWRHFVRKKLQKQASKALQKEHFSTKPVLQRVISQIHQMSVEISIARFFDLEKNVAYSLDAFIEMQQRQCNQVKAKMAQLSDKAISETKEACLLVLTSIEKELLEKQNEDCDANSKSENSSLKPRKSSGMNKLATVALKWKREKEKAVEERENRERYAFAVSVAKRNERQRLLKFLRLADYVITQCLRQSVIGSFIQLLQKLLHNSMQQTYSSLEVSNTFDIWIREEFFKHSDPVLKCRKGQETLEKNRLPVFQVNLIIKDDRLQIHPSLSDFEKKFEQLAKNIPDAVKTVQRLITHPDLVNIIESVPVDNGAPSHMELIGEKQLVALQSMIKTSISLDFQDAEATKVHFQPFLDVFIKNRSISIESMQKEVDQGQRDIGMFHADLDLFLQQITDINNLPLFQDVGAFRINNAILKESLLPSPQKCLQGIFSLLPQILADRHKVFIDEIHLATKKLLAKPSSVEEFVEIAAFLQSLQERIDSLEEQYLGIKEYINLMQDYKIPVPEIDLTSYQLMGSEFNACKEAMLTAEEGKMENVKLFSVELVKQMDDVRSEVNSLRQQARHDMILDENCNMQEVLGYVCKLSEDMTAQKSQFQRIQQYRQLFQMDEIKYDELQEVADEVEMKKTLWQSLEELGIKTTTWANTHFEKLPMEEIEEAVQKYAKLVVKLERLLLPNKVTGRLRKLVDEFRFTLPVIQNLKNKSLKERHWKKIEAEMGKKLERNASFTLGKLLELKIMEFKGAIGNIANEAIQEAALEELLKKVQDKWMAIEFIVKPYKEIKDVYVLGSIDDVVASLEDSMVTMNTVTSSRYVTGIRSEVEKVEGQLKHFGNVLDEWLECQKQWMYLESIFSAPDIQRQLPNESKAFNAVDKQFKDIMKRVHDRPNALQAGSTPGWLETFEKCNETLEKIQKNLEDYLETKRMAFPRFYFLSNDELLEILAQTRNVQAVQPHMSKCFDGIRRLDFGDDPRSVDIYAMISSEGEKVSLGKNLKARGNVENWLTAVEQNMISSLRRLAKLAHQDYAKRPRKDWVLKHPAQLVIMISQVYWCFSVESVFAASKGAAIQSDLLEIKDQCIRQLEDLSVLVRGNLLALERRILTALITIDVHARDIVEGLAREKVFKGSDFGWQMQLRYYWDDNVDDCMIRQTNASFLYGYEYLGAQPRLVITPLTDRCYMTLTGALHLKLGGAPAGPAGTGKTETTKDLAKALGIQCVVFNCGDNLDYKFMGKFFAGLAQCGAWACFDEFNRIDIEVLSVVAQQLLTIQNALKVAMPRFNFEGREIKLLPTCGVFITMNPGYAGRTELPDNLKVLFRPVSMMIPDYALVAEVMLFSEGFANAKILSRKMVKLYKLSSEQLSQQDHYDFGMRAVKSVLVMAGSLKRSNPDLNEDAVLIRAFKDSNLPKFLAQDVGLFLAIIADLFPGVNVPPQDFGVLKAAVEECIVDAGLQPVPGFVLKTIQLYETMNVRFGVMAVGPTGGGKTTCYQMLQTAMTKLCEAGNPNPSFQVTQSYVLNPKSIKMGELYGEYNLLTNEWTDGLGSTIIRQCVSDTTADRKWVVFDGPVDAIWIENMNTVLDDNCILCLPNGERIKLNPVTMRMLFEVQDLAVASPATVSRCGMVYVPPEDLGWRPYVRTWLQKLSCYLGLTEAIPSTVTDYIWNLCDMYIDKGLKFLRQQCMENIPSVNINIVTSLCYYFQALCQPSKEVNLKQDLELLGPILNKFFCFSFIWSVGGNIDHHSIEKFDVFVRKDMEVIATFPESDLVYDYFFNPRDQTFTHWEIVVPGFVYHHGAPFFTLMVPTQDSTKLSFLMEISLEVQRSVLFQGVSGVGKSAIILDLLNRLQETKNMMLIVLNFSAQTTSIATQEAIESKLEKKRRTKLGAPLGKKIACFVDDVNMPAKERYGAQPAIELLRQFLDFKGFYDRRQLFWKDIEDMTILTACAPPGGGRNEVTPRFFRHFSMLCVQPPSEQCLRTIFGGILGGFLNFFPSECKNFQKPMVESTIEIYTRISQELLPTPAKSHYTFNLRDVSKVFQGILMVKPGDCGTKRAFRSLWVHESMRVFYDRLINNEDREYFKQMIYDLLKRNFEETGTYEEVYGKSPMFGDYLKPGCAIDERRYEQVLDESRLPQLFKDYLEDYNASTTSIMKLVFFKDAIEHISRISRILRQPRGNAMLVGVGGSGKQSLTRFACFMGDYKCVQIELKKGYNMVDYREDLKKLYKIAGVEGIPVTFLLTDTQIINEGFIEDINNLLNSGEIPGLFTSDEKDRVAGDIREYVTNLGLPETKDVLYSSFINRARDNLHIVLCMSPVGDSFRARCRKFPSLINCCTIDWFNEWPEDALLSVSKHFLASVDLSTEQVKNNIANMCVEIHISVSQMAERFYQELRRKYYITPKSYLDCVNLYIQLLGEKRQELSMAQDRFMNGLNKLKETNVLIESMKVELGKLQPILAEKAAQTEKLIKQVANDQEAAQKVKEVVAKEESEVKKQAEETQLMKDDAQKDLDAAMPALNASVEALNSLNKNDITEIKSFAKPPPLVQLVMEAVCVLLGEKPNWDTSKKIMGDVAFIRRLLEYNKDGIIPALQKKLAKYIEDPSFQPELVQKQSNAATSLCLWVRAMDVYAKVAKDVAPKKEALRLAEEALKGAAEKLSSKQQQLAQVEAQVERLKKNLQGTEAEQAHLQQQALITENRLRRAGKLTAALSDESVRWKETADEIEAQKELLVGDVFICAACIAYYGAFSGQYRKALVSSWIRNCQEKKIPVSIHCSLRGTLSTAVEVREWSIWGLPTDDVSVDNGILVTRGKRWPLMIDPQGQANSWIKAMEAKNGLRVVRLTDTNILRTLESSIRIGNPVLLEDIGDTLDPALEPILQKQVFEKNGRYLIRIGDSDIDYDPNFRFYMTTKMSNPHYMPDICIKVTLVNFTVTMKGLEDQLLGDVVRKERADLEEQNDRLVVSISSDKKQLKDLEDKILKLLKESQGNILDDEVLINTLNNSKLTSSVIQGRVKQAEVTEKEITAAREQYRVVSNRGSILYFVVSDLALIDSMYQYSLSFFCHLFSHCIDVSDKSDELDVRLKTLIDFTTEFVYVNVSRGLFEQHKLTFSFLICTSIMRSAGEIQEAEWNFFLRGFPAAAASASKPAKNPGSQYLAESVWHKICAFEEIDKHNMDGLTKHITDHFAMWKPFLESPEPHFIAFPDGWDEKLNPFQRLVLLKCLREEKLVYSCEAFIRTALGNRFVETPPLQLEEVFKETSKTAPIIFILSTGADPTGMLQRFGEKVDRKPGERLHIISLGQGQGPIAEMLVSKSRKTGDWVCLQNCHLASSWMQTMERIIERFVPEAEDIHPEFRLWLTSLPCKEFPVPVLQNGIKITNEPPKGIRANLLQSYANISDEFLESCTKKRPWKKLVYAISFFHAVVQERRKFGPLGWNVRYDFNNSDLECAMQTLHMFLEEQPEIPWPALLYVTGEITYGGRVTDDLDRRCLMSTLLRFYNPDVLSDSYAFTPSRVYISPPEGNYHLFVEGIKSLPVTEGPDVFGMHENANLTFQLQESNKILSNISNIQPQVTTAGGAKSPEKIVSEVAERILADLPSPLKDSEGTSTSALGPDGQISPLAVVLMQECDRYNKLLSIMKSTLSELQRAIKGLVVMSSELENMFNSFLSNQVPALWNAVAYPSLKPLSSWVVDFHKRMNFMFSWIVNGEPKCFWLPGFFFPQGFLTGALQLHARKYQIPIDTLNFGFNVMELSNEEDVPSAPVDGLYVSGLFLDGARWDQKRHYLSEAFPGEMHCALPIVHLIPTENYKPPTEEYQCPLYKTHVRAGVLTTTGASSNFVLNVSLKIDPQTNPDFWVLQGVALLCQLGH